MPCNDPDCQECGGRYWGGGFFQGGYWGDDAEEDYDDEDDHDVYPIIAFNNGYPVMPQQRVVEPVRHNDHDSKTCQCVDCRMIRQREAAALAARQAQELRQKTLEDFEKARDELTPKLKTKIQELVTQIKEVAKDKEGLSEYGMRFKVALLTQQQNKFSRMQNELQFHGYSTPHKTEARVRDRFNQLVQDMQAVKNQVTKENINSLAKQHSEAIKIPLNRLERDLDRLLDKKKKQDKRIHADLVTHTQNTIRYVKSVFDSYVGFGHLAPLKAILKERMERYDANDMRKDKHIIQDNDVFNANNYLTSIKTHGVGCNRFSDAYLMRNYRKLLNEGHNVTKPKCDHDTAISSIHVTKHELLKTQKSTVMVSKRDKDGRVSKKHYDTLNLLNSLGNPIGYVRPHVGTVLLKLQKDYSKFNVNFKAYFGDEPYTIGEQTIDDVYHKSGKTEGKRGKGPTFEELEKQLTKKSSNNGYSSSSDDDHDEYEAHEQQKENEEPEEDHDIFGGWRRRRPARRAAPPPKALSAQQIEAAKTRIASTVYEIPIKIDVYATPKDTRTKDKEFQKRKKTLKDIKNKVQKDIQKESLKWDRQTIKLENCLDRVKNSKIKEEQKTISQLQKLYNNVGKSFNELQLTAKGNNEFTSANQPRLLKSDLTPHQLHFTGHRMRHFPS